MSMSKLKNVIFVEPPGDDYTCPICYDALQEPYLTTCCGNHFCRICIENVRKANDRCPMCQTAPLDGVINKHLQRKIKELKVYCTYKEEGCQWIGHFGKMHDHHLLPDKVNGECQFIHIACQVSIHCKVTLPRKKIVNHMNNLCQYRQVECMYCGDVSTYHNITSMHVNQCVHYPLLCPNNCSNQTYPRNQLTTHLTTCPNQKIDCTYSKMGCTSKIKRQFLQHHLETNMFQHQLLMCQAFEELSKDKQELEVKVKLLTQEVQSNLEDNQSKCLKFLALNDKGPLYFSKMAELSILNPVAPLVFEIPLDFVEELCTKCEQTRRRHFHYTAPTFYSQPFHNHPTGYKLRLSVDVICCCSCCGDEQRAPVNRQFQPVPVDRQLLAQHSFESPFQSSTAPVNRQFQPVPAYRQFQPVPANWQLQRTPARYQSGSVPGNHWRISKRDNAYKLAVNLYILQGDCDPQLKWPFNEKVTITYNQKGNKSCCTAEAIFEGNRNFTSGNSRLKLFNEIRITERKRDMADFESCSSPEVVLPVSLDNGLLFPMDGFPLDGFSMDGFLMDGYQIDDMQHRKWVYYFEVTFISQRQIA